MIKKYSKYNAGKKFSCDEEYGYIELAYSNIYADVYVTLLQLYKEKVTSELIHETVTYLSTLIYNNIEFEVDLVKFCKATYKWYRSTISNPHKRDTELRKLITEIARSEDSSSKPKTKKRIEYKIICPHCDEEIVLQVKMK